MKPLKTLVASVALVAAGFAFVEAKAASVTLPDENALNLNDVTVTSGTVENGGANIGSTGINTVVEQSVYNTVEQTYYFQFKAGHGQAAGAVWNATINSVSDNGDKTVVASEDFTIIQTSNWRLEQQCELPLENLPVGAYEMVLTVKALPENNRYAGNIGDIRFSTVSCYNTIPGAWDLSKALVAVGLRYEDSNQNLGYVRNNTSATYTAIVTEPGEYTMVGDYTYYNESHIDITVTDIASGKVEATAAIDRTAAGNGDRIRLNGELSVGLKTVEMKFTSASDGFLFNLNHVSFVKSEPVKEPHLSGSINGWSTDDTSYLFTTIDDVHYTLELPRLYGEWKVTLNDGWYATEGAQAVNTDMTLSTTAPNFNIWSDNATLVLTLNADGTPAAIRVNGEYIHPVYFCGDQTAVDGDWLVNKIAMVPKGNNVYELTLPNGISGGWKINDGTWDWFFGCGDLSGQGGVMLDFVDNDAWFKSSLNFVHNTIDETLIRFTLDNASATDNAPSKLWIEERGNIPVYFVNSEGWDQVRIHFWNNDGTINTTWPGAFMHPVAEATPAVKAYAVANNDVYEVALPAGTQNIIFNNGNGEQTENLAVSYGQVYHLGAKNAEGKYTAYTENYDGTTGVEDVTAAPNDEAEYYDLRGLRVTNPRPGQLYILRQGNTVSKVRK